ncbi:MAG: hypothetical protein P8X89_06670 [Reinekea sp.]
MGAPTIFEQQITIKLIHSASALESRIQVKHTLTKSERPSNAAHRVHLNPELC